MDPVSQRNLSSCPAIKPSSPASLAFHELPNILPLNSSSQILSYSILVSMAYQQIDQDTNRSKYEKK